MNIYEQIRQWSIEKGLTNKTKQRIKFKEEVGELCGAYLKNDNENIIMELADCLVVLTIIYWQENESIEDWIECYQNLIPIKLLDDLDVMLNSNDRLINLFDIVGLAKSLNISLDSLAQLAYDKIKNRRGVTINETFIKE